MNIRTKAITVAVAAVLCTETAAAFKLTNTAGLGAMVSIGRENLRVIRVWFKASQIPQSLHAQFAQSGGRYHVVAILTDGRMFSYTDAGWLPSTEATLHPFRERNGAIAAEIPPVDIINGDISGATWATIYVGIEVGGELFYTALGGVIPPRPTKAVTFPYFSGDWTVVRSVDRITGNTSCTITGTGFPDRGYQAMPYFYKGDRNTAATLGMLLRHTATGSYPASVSYSDSMVRVEGYPATTLGAAYPQFPPPTSTFYDDAGRKTLYGNYEPLMSRLMNGTNLIARYVSNAGVFRYDGVIRLAGFPAGMDAFDYCVSTQ